MQLTSGWHTGIDYVTITIPNNHPQYGFITATTNDYLTELSKENQPKSAYAKGGYVGWHCKDFTALFGEKTTIFRSSGDASGGRLYQLWREGCNVTRIDLQTTVWYKGNLDKIMDKSKAMIERAMVEKLTDKQKLTDINSNDGGRTIYIGARTSDVFMRIYKKYEESKNDYYKGAIRYELELKHKVAKNVGYEIAEQMEYDGELSTSTMRRITATVANEFSQVGLLIPTCEGELYSLAGEQTRTDVARKLAWLENQVSPSVVWLGERGFWQEALRALGVVGYDISDYDIGY